MDGPPLHPVPSLTADQAAHPQQGTASEPQLPLLPGGTRPDSREPRRQDAGLEGPQWGGVGVRGLRCWACFLGSCRLRWQRGREVDPLGFGEGAAGLWAWTGVFASRLLTCEKGPAVTRRQPRATQPVCTQGTVDKREARGLLLSLFPPELTSTWQLQAGLLLSAVGQVSLGAGLSSPSPGHLLCG